jgi:hypothetical protein
MTHRSKRQFVPLAPPVRTPVVRRAVLGRVAPLLLPLLLVNAAAVWGQAGWAYERITEPGWAHPARLALAILFATAIESVGIFLAWEAHLAMMADQASGPLRAGSYGVGGLAGWINWDHWHRGGVDDTRAATFAGLSAISPWLWSIWSRARNRTRLAELDLADARGLKLSTNRKFWHPVRSVKLIRWAAWSGETRPAVAVSAWEALAQPVQKLPAAPATTAAPPETPRPRTSATTGRTSPPVAVPGVSPDRPAPGSNSGPKKAETSGETGTESDMVRGRAEQRKRIDRALAVYRESVDNGAPHSARDLAGLFSPMSESWARKVINASATAAASNGRAT